MSSRARVLYVDYSVGFGGSTKSLALTLRALPEVEKSLLTTQDTALVRTWFSQLPVSRFRRIMNNRNRGRIHERIDRYLNIPAFRWLALKTLAAIDLFVALKNCLRLVWFIRRKAIDVIHLNNGFEPLEVLLASRFTRTPYVVHLRGFWAETGGIAYRNSKHAAKVITVSDAVGQQLEHSLISPEKIVTIYDPVDLDAIDRAASAREALREECSIGDGEVAVGIFGRVIPWKGQMEFVRAAIGAMQQNSSIRALIVGDESDGSRDYLDAIRSTIAASRFAERFVLTGYRTNVEDYYAAVDIVVHASVAPEPFGMVVPEAMAAFRPPIATDAGGPREVITHGVDGLLVPPGDVPAMTRAILELAGDPERRVEMGIRGRQKVLERFQITTNAAQVRRIYEALLPPERLSRKRVAASDARVGRR